MDILTVFRKLALLEQELGKTYAWFVTLFPGDDQAVEFFEKLASDEKLHEDIVRYQERVVRKTPKEFAPVEADVQALDRTLSAIAEFRKTTPTLTGAIRFALDMETEVGEHYSTTIMEQSNPEFAQMVRGMAVSQDGHYQALLAFAKGLASGDSTGTRQ